MDATLVGMSFDDGSESQHTTTQQLGPHPEQELVMPGELAGPEVHQVFAVVGEVRLLLLSTGNVVALCPVVLQCAKPVGKQRWEQRWPVSGCRPHHLLLLPSRPSDVNVLSWLGVGRWLRRCMSLACPREHGFNLRRNVVRWVTISCLQPHCARIHIISTGHLDHRSITVRHGSVRWMVRPEVRKSVENNRRSDFVHILRNGLPIHLLLCNSVARSFGWR